MVLRPSVPRSSYAVLTATSLPSDLVLEHQSVHQSAASVNFPPGMQQKSTYPSPTTGRPERQSARGSTFLKHLQLQGYLGPEPIAACCLKRRSLIFPTAASNTHRLCEHLGTSILPKYSQAQALMWMWICGALGFPNRKLVMRCNRATHGTSWQMVRDQRSYCKPSKRQRRFHAAMLDSCVG